jgi:hypothetical protein
VLQKETHRSASDILNIAAWVERTYGFDGWWTAFQFNRAVTYFGRYIEAASMERDDKQQLVYTLDELLSYGVGGVMQTAIAEDDPHGTAKAWLRSRPGAGRSDVDFFSRLKGKNVQGKMVERR